MEKWHSTKLPFFVRLDTELGQMGIYNLDFFFPVTPDIGSPERRMSGYFTLAPAVVPVTRQAAPSTEIILVHEFKDSIFGNLFRRQMLTNESLSADITSSI